MWFLSRGNYVNTRTIIQHGENVENAVVNWLYYEINSNLMENGGKFHWKMKVG